MTTEQKIFERIGDDWGERSVSSDTLSLTEFKFIPVTASAAMIERLTFHRSLNNSAHSH